jgi:hypothetical protein
MPRTDVVLHRGSALRADRGSDPPGPRTRTSPSPAQHRRPAAPARSPSSSRRDQPAAWHPERSWPPRRRPPARRCVTRPPPPGPPPHPPGLRPPHQLRPAGTGAPCLRRQPDQPRPAAAPTPTDQPRPQPPAQPRRNQRPPLTTDPRTSGSWTPTGPPAWYRRSAQRSDPRSSPPERPGRRDAASRRRHHEAGHHGPRPRTARTVTLRGHHRTHRPAPRRRPTRETAASRPLPRPHAAGAPHAVQRSRNRRRVRSRPPPPPPATRTARGSGFNDRASRAGCWVRVPVGCRRCSRWRTPGRMAGWTCP